MGHHNLLLSRHLLLFREQLLRHLVLVVIVLSCIHVRIRVECRENRLTRVAYRALRANSRRSVVDTSAAHWSDAAWCHSPTHMGVQIGGGARDPTPVVSFEILLAIVVVLPARGDRLRRRVEICHEVAAFEELHGAIIVTLHHVALLLVNVASVYALLCAPVEVGHSRVLAATLVLKLIEANWRTACLRGILEDILLLWADAMGLLGRAVVDDTA